MKYIRQEGGRYVVSLTHAEFKAMSVAYGSPTRNRRWKLRTFNPESYAWFHLEERYVEPPEMQCYEWCKVTGSSVASMAAGQIRNGESWKPQSAAAVIRTNKRHHELSHANSWGKWEYRVVFKPSKPLPLP